MGFLTTISKIVGILTLLYLLTNFLTKMKEFITKDNFPSVLKWTSLAVVAVTIVLFAPAAIARILKIFFKA